MRKTGIFVIIVLLINALSLLTGCKKNDEEELKEKIISELGYVNIKIIDILNSLNNISFENYTIDSKQVELDAKSQSQQSKQGEGNKSEGSSTGEEQNNKEQDNKQEEGSQNLINTTQMVTDTILTKKRDDIDWKTIKPEIELLNETWSIIILDLYSLNVNSNTILEFSSKLNTTIIAIKNENKQESLIALAALYRSLPDFLKEIDADKNLQRIRQTQSYVINAYSLADNILNPEINNNLQNAVDKYLQVMSDIDYTKDKTFKTNKVYVLLNELVNSLNNKDSDLFYVKYKNFMETINEL